MKKLYIQPQTIEAVCLPQTNMLIPGSGEGPEPGGASARLVGTTAGASTASRVLYI